MKIFPILLLLLLLYCGCGKVSVDNTDPSVEVFLLNNQETLNSLTVGTTLNIELYITDNEELVEVVVRILNTSNSALSQTDKLLHFSSYGEIDSKQFGKLISIPTDVTDLAGKYEILIQVVDGNGNADSRVQEFTLLNPEEQPQIDINGFNPPEVDGIIYMNPGDSLVIDGWIIDNTGLSEIEITLSGPQNLHNENVVIEEPEFLSYGFQYLAVPKIPDEAETGEYLLRAVVKDVDGHMIFYSQDVQVE